MKIVTEFPRKVVEFPVMGIVMPDGCRLSARVWMPEAAGNHPVPAILVHLPSRNRDGASFRDHLPAPYFGCHGYASFYLNAAQREPELSQTVNAAREAFTIIRDALETKSVAQKLECDVQKDAFRRLVR